MAQIRCWTLKNGVWGSQIWDSAESAWIDEPLPKMVYSFAPPAEPPLSETEIASLRLVVEGKAWKVEWPRLETLINKGLVNALGTEVTEKGTRAAAKKLT